MSGLLLAEKTGEAAKAGPIGLAVILLLIIACYFLFKSMSKHMKRVREDFPADGFPTGRMPSGEKTTEQTASEQTAPDGKQGAGSD